MARDRGVHPDCPNAPNPFHICADYCSHGPVPRSNVPDKKDILVSNGFGRKENDRPLKGDEMMENPQEHLPRSNIQANKEILVSNGFGSKENGAIGNGGRGRIVDPLCVNASNPPLKGDEMMENPQEHLPRSANKEILVSNGVGSKENGAIGQGGRRRIVDPLCVNASNPPLKGDEMIENPQEHLPRSNTPANKEILVLNGVRSKENGEKVEGGRRRSVDPLCVNASNPFHQCADYCIRRNHEGKSPLNGSYKFGGTKEKEGITDKRKVNPNCPNASNPFHQCAGYCSARSFAVEKHKQGNAGESSSKGGLIVAQRKDVNPGCVNASNPFHKCTEYCSQTRRN